MNTPEIEVTEIEAKSLTEVCEHKDLFTALCAASAKFDPITTNGAVKYGGTEFDYADVHACIAATKHHLLDHGLIPFFDTKINGKTVTNTFVLVHKESGQMKRFCSIPVDATSIEAKQIGAANTYGRRYAIISALCLAVVEPEKEEIDNCDKEDFQSVKRGFPKEINGPIYQEQKPPRTTAEVKERLLNDCRELYRSLSPEAKQELVISMQITPADMPTYDVDKLLAIKSFMKDKTKVVIGQTNAKP